MNRQLYILIPLVFAFSCADAEANPGDPVYDDNSEVDPASDRTLLFYYGPMKLMNGETILNSIAAVTGHDFGTWDFTAPDSLTDAFDDAGNSDGAFYRHCRFFGGCMQHRIPLERTSFVGTGYVLELERAVVEACSDRETFGMFPGRVAPAGTVSVADVIRHQYRVAFSAEPDADELDHSRTYFEGHLADPEAIDISALESAGRGHCRVLLTTNRFLFY